MTGVGINRERTARWRAPTRGIAAAVLLALAVAGCSSANVPGDRQVAAMVPPAQPMPEMSPAQQREHLRILAAYGGSYQNPRIEAMLSQTVDKLVAASERP